MVLNVCVIPSLQICIKEDSESLFCCRYIYWSDWGKSPRIERAHLDGSQRMMFVYTNITQPWGLTIDYDTHRLYWCDNHVRGKLAMLVLSH